MSEEKRPYVKDFEGWNKVKQKIDNEHELPLFNEREIWWCSVGVNVGFEIFGKGGSYTRPVLVLRKYGSHSFLGIPLTSKPKKAGAYYHPIRCNEVDGYALLGQFRIMDSKRLIEIIGKIGKKQHNTIKEGVRRLI